MTTSTRETIRAAAAANDWEIAGRGLNDTFTRRGEVVTVDYTVRGGINLVGRKADGARYLTEISGAGRAAAVRTLLAGPATLTPPGLGVAACPVLRPSVHPC